MGQHRLTNMLPKWQRGTTSCRQHVKERRAEFYHLRSRTPERIEGNYTTHDLTLPRGVVRCGRLHSSDRVMTTGIMPAVRSTATKGEGHCAPHCNNGQGGLKPYPVLPAASAGTTTTACKKSLSPCKTHKKKEGGTTLTFSSQHPEPDTTATKESSAYEYWAI